MTFFARYHTFLQYLGLIALWNLFVGAFKIFFYTTLGTLYPMLGYPPPTLEAIAGYLSLGSIIAYIVGGAIVTMFPRRMVLASSAIVSLVLLVAIWHTHFAPPWVFFGVTAVIGFFYGIFSIIRNSLVFVEMHRLHRSDTFVNGIAVVVFIVAVLVGSYLGTFAFSHGSPFLSIGIFVGMLSLIALLASVLRYDTDMHYPDIHVWSHIRDNVYEFRVMFSRYLGIIMASTLLWTVSTVLIQQIFEFAVHALHRDGHEALRILVASMAGGVIGNLMTIGVTQRRFEIAATLSFLFAVSIACIPLSLGWSIGPFRALLFLSVVLGVFFGGAANLIDGYYYLRIGMDGQKEYGSALIGLVLSVVIVAMMTTMGALYRIGMPLSLRLGFLVVITLLVTLIMLVSRHAYHGEVGSEQAP